MEKRLNMRVTEIVEFEEIQVRNLVQYPSDFGPTGKNHMFGIL